MRPVEPADGVFAFAITAGLANDAQPLALSRALRRAVMARVQERMGQRATLPTFFTGHGSDGAPSRSGRHEHLAFVFDGPRQRLLIVAPHILERREASKTEHEQYLPALAESLGDLQELRAGTAGKLALLSGVVEHSDDPLFGRSPAWESVTPYCVTGHAKLGQAAAALEADLLTECRRAGLPRPRIEVSESFGKPDSGLFGRARLTFRAAIAGPLMLGRDRHFGGGLFAAAK
ncbi:MAG: type I-G CRISPR-associated protein Csb2 [Rhizomicrobium sp.]